MKTITWNELSQREKEIVYNTLCELQEAGNDHEAQFVEDLAVRAGLWWKCSPGSCNYVNAHDDTNCGSCGARKP